ncbi:hypothetical protein ACP70R_015285 [Stipagrostis hirtigluma subsp. patula]
MAHDEANLSLSESCCFLPPDRRRALPSAATPFSRSLARAQVATKAMASPERAAEPRLVQEPSSPSSAAAAAAVEQDEAAQERATGPDTPEAEADRDSEEDDDDDEEEEEKKKREFIRYMMCGGCGDAFMAWAAAKKGALSQSQAASNLNKCMAAHADYYAPVLLRNDHTICICVRTDAAEKDKEAEEEKKDGTVLQPADPSQPAAGEGRKE